MEEYENQGNMLESQKRKNGEVATTQVNGMIDLAWIPIQTWIQPKNFGANSDEMIFIAS